MLGAACFLIYIYITSLISLILWGINQNEVFYVHIEIAKKHSALSPLGVLCSYGNSAIAQEVI